MRNEKICHLRCCRLVTNEETCAFRFGGSDYVLQFASPAFRRGEGLVIQGPADQLHLDMRLLRWIEVYPGENIASPDQEIDTMNSAVRGDLKFDAKVFVRFLARVEKLPGRSWPAWRVELFDRALTYFSMGVRLGINAMPMSMGMHALSLECIGNLYGGSRVKYFELGAKRFMRLADVRLQRYKKLGRFSAHARGLDRRIHQDVDLMHLMRNAYYGHSSTHLTKVHR